MLSTSAICASQTGGVGVVVDDDDDEVVDDDEVDVEDVEPDEEVVPVGVPVVFGFVVVLVCCVPVVGAMSGFLLQPPNNVDTRRKIGRKARFMVILNGLHNKRLR